MLSLLLTLGLAFAAAASTGQDPGCIPRPSASRGFRLVVNVTDPSSDLSPSIQGSFLSLAHIGPAQNRAIILPTEGPVFYQNGTFKDITMQRIGILTDGGTPPFPEGLTYASDSGTNTTQGAPLFVNAGASGGGTRLTRLWDPYSYLTILSNVVESTLVVCNSTIPYYGESRFFNVVNWVTARRDATGTHLVLPEGCAAIRLVPQCAVLNELPEGAYSSHEFAQEVRCYEDVGAIDWSKYPY